MQTDVSMAEYSAVRWDGLMVASKGETTVERMDASKEAPWVGQTDASMAVYSAARWDDLSVASMGETTVVTKDER